MAKKPYYSDKPFVSSKKMADVNPSVNQPRVGSLPNYNVAPKRPGYSPGVVQPKKLKMSGHPRSHRVGHR